MNRSKNFTEGEKLILINLIKDRGFLDIIQSKKNDSTTLSKKESTWKSIELCFNAQSAIQRTLKQLQTLWRDMKARAKQDYTLLKKERMKTGGGTCDVTLDVVSQAMIDVLPQCLLEPISGVNDSDVAMHESTNVTLPVDNQDENEVLDVNYLTSTPVTKKRKSTVPVQQFTESDVLSTKVRVLEEYSQQQKQQHDLKMDILRTIKRNLDNSDRVSMSTQTEPLMLLDLLNM